MWSVHDGNVIVDFLSTVPCCFLRHLPGVMPSGNYDWSGDGNYNGGGDEKGTRVDSISTSSSRGQSDL